MTGPQVDESNGGMDRMNKSSIIIFFAVSVTSIAAMRWVPPLWDVFSNQNTQKLSENLCSDDENYVDMLNGYSLCLPSIAFVSVEHQYKGFSPKEYKVAHLTYLADGKRLSSKSVSELSQSINPLNREWITISIKGKCDHGEVLNLSNYYADYVFGKKYVVSPGYGINVSKITLSPYENLNVSEGELMDKSKFIRCSLDTTHLPLDRIFAGPYTDCIEERRIKNTPLCVRIVFPAARLREYDEIIAMSDQIVTTTLRSRKEPLQ